MTPIPISEQKEIAKNWCGMKEEFYRQSRLIAELAAHPEVTDQMILERVRELGKTYNQLRAVSKLIYEMTLRQRFSYHAPIDPNF
jgi:hypothetical protein